MPDFTMTVKQEVRAKTLIAEMGVRYWEDASVDGVNDDEGDRIPLRKGDAWLIKVDLDTGRIFDWPEGVTASTHYKVCDEGVYTVLSDSGDVIAKRDGYVPSMLSPGSQGYGDYVIMDIGPDGVIKNFRCDLSYFEDEN